MFRFFNILCEPKIRVVQILLDRFQLQKMYVKQSSPPVLFCRGSSGSHLLVNLEAEGPRKNHFHCRQI